MYDFDTASVHLQDSPITFHTGKNGNYMFVTYFTFQFRQNPSQIFKHFNNLFSFQNQIPQAVITDAVF
jgi:hypothetical protein